MKNIKLVFLVCFACISNLVMAQSQRELGQLMRERGEYYFTLKVSEPTEIQTLSRLCSIDATDGRLVVAYANQQEYDKLLDLGYQPNLQTPPSLREEAKMWDGNRATYEWDSYPTYNQYVSMMQGFPASVVSGRTCTLIDLGQLSTSAHRHLYGVRINNGNPDGKPKFLYSSTMHGDEITGMILMLRLIDELCTSTETRIVDLVNNLDIFIFPNTNPDGTYKGGNNTVTGAQRANGHNIDLNRHYPDFDKGPHPDGQSSYQDETQWLMNLAQEHLFTMAANYHGGAEVMNYPWDTYQPLHPDDAWWQLVCHEYANLAHQQSSSYMKMSGSDNGIINGYAWYTISGSRQDYMNYYAQCREVTVECSKTKTPNASSLPNYWNYNHNSMLAYMEQCLKGIHGTITDAVTGQPIVGASVVINNHDALGSSVTSHAVGDYHRPIKGGTYQVSYSATGYVAQTLSVTAVDNQTTVQNVQLIPEGTCIFNGTTSSSWSVAANWQDGQMPTANVPVIITANCLMDSDATLSALKVYDGMTLTIGSGHALSVSNVYTMAATQLVVQDGGQLHTMQPVEGTMQKYIAGTDFGTPQNPTSAGYYLIANPAVASDGGLAVSAVTNLTANSYDLYEFDQTADLEWQNLKAQQSPVMYPKTGYLYANNGTVTLVFAGTLNSQSDEYTLTHIEGHEFTGWNLIGNPYAYETFIQQPYFRLNAAGDHLAATTETGAIAPTEAVFVYTEAGGTYHFSTSRSLPVASQININVSRDRGTAVDNAIVRFDEGLQLPKFMLDANGTKLYIPQGSKDYAVVNSNGQGEMPISFKASEDGTYTLSVNAENAEMDYLHLVDNLTGMDIDLLQTPSYSFKARTTDYANRFKLVFRANENGASTGSATFALYNGNSWTVSNIGEATLQVIDMLGHVVSSQTINGNADITLNQAGVYVMRLIKGNDTKVQKIVVK